MPHLGQREALSIQFRKPKPGRNHSGHSGAAPLTRGGSGGLAPLTGGSSGGSEAGCSEAGGSEAGGSEADGSEEGSSSSGSRASGEVPLPPATPHYMHSGRALVVKNLPPSLPYEAVRVFFSQ